MADTEVRAGPGSLYLGSSPHGTCKMTAGGEFGILLSREEKLSEGHLKEQKEKGRNYRFNEGEVS